MSCDFGHITLSIPATGTCTKRDNIMQSTTFLPQKVEDVLDFVQDARVFFKDLLAYILDDKGPRCSSYQHRVFDDLYLRLTRYLRGVGSGPLVQDH